MFEFDVLCRVMSDIIHAASCYCTCSGVAFSCPSRESEPLSSSSFVGLDLGCVGRTMLSAQAPGPRGPEIEVFAPAASVPARLPFREKSTKDTFSERTGQA